MCTENVLAALGAPTFKSPMFRKNCSIDGAAAEEIHTEVRPG
jgi:hypothetical protein